MFEKILIANRGEIALRIEKTARRLGVRCVAVYSAADRDALHVRLADEAVLIGPAAAAESYLAGERIIEAARAAGAQAIHPGYGFLAENAEFARRCADAGIIFVGPPVEAMRTMASKAAAKALMVSCGVPVLPGYHGDDQEASRLAERAREIGYPLLIKATFGGGGKGMRLVRRQEDFLPALEACRREASAAFGADAVILERYLDRARHIEVQIFGDARGGIVHLFERDCSAQRRHQKVVEEAPAPHVGVERRAALTAAAINAARAVGYVGAGTVEFIADRRFAANGEFYFMEMNTRLQVEHPVTEMVTGIDLVEWQLRVAAGEALPLAQDEITLRGHAMEARVYAEDPARDFLPSVGTLCHLAAPAESPHVRVNSGVAQGDAITRHYDAMIAKLVVWDESRERAQALMLKALADYRIVGVASNVGFLSRLVASASFAAGTVNTGFIEREPGLADSDEAPAAQEAWLLVALAELLREAERARLAAARDPDPHSPWHLRDGWRINGSGTRRIRLRQGHTEHAIAVAYAGQDYELAIDAGGAPALARGELGDDGELRADLAGLRLTATVIAAGSRRHVFVHGRSHLFVCVDPVQEELQASGGAGRLVAPMPAKVVAIAAQPGARVEKGAPLVVLEAMKMEHTVTAPAAGKVRRFRFAPGDQVEEGTELAEFEPDQDANEGAQ